MPRDLFHPSQAEEKTKHKLKRLIQTPNSFFMDVRCPGCFHITTIFSHAQVGPWFAAFMCLSFSFSADRH
jgi:small subunit ribosomal protein S27e